ncbi:methyltransferase domain-containing protein [Aminobacter sp. AP02]|uniref:class I SAM-dependent methyltransferase n=1 Tax=Aminobacter sp. AP02 TaxID=2135737 RepID=UPI000D6BD791|nr:methyltransferase domain-containing protein [Aminobacter sp. AP02]PWK65886.1 methyltransferase family protein [Aminobacter sp. AP02]
MDLSLTKLNLGCGWDIREGFLNVDLHDFTKPDLVADILNLEGLPSSHYQEIVAQDVLEHVERAKQLPALKEWARLLSPTGRLYIRVPSLFDMLKLGLQPSWQTLEKHSQLVHMIYGTQAYNGDYHLAGHTALTLADVGQQVGLIVCESRLRDEWLYEVWFRKGDNPDLLTDQEFVHHTYFTKLGRPVDVGGLEHSIGFIEQKGRAEFVDGILASDEYNALIGKDQSS